MPRGNRLLIGREVAGEIFPGPPPCSGSALAAFLWLESVGGRSGMLGRTARWNSLSLALQSWRIAPWTYCAFYFYTMLSACSYFRHSIW
jgi:hypothetical protein